MVEHRDSRHPGFRTESNYVESARRLELQAASEKGWHSGFKAGIQQSLKRDRVVQDIVDSALERFSSRLENSRRLEDELRAAKAELDQLKSEQPPQQRRKTRRGPRRQQQPAYNPSDADQFDV